MLVQTTSTSKLESFYPIQFKNWISHFTPGFIIKQSTTQLNYSVLTRYKIWIPPTSGCYQNHNHRNSCKHRLKSKYHTVATFQILHVKSQVVLGQLLFLPEAWTSIHNHSHLLFEDQKGMDYVLQHNGYSCTLRGTDLGFTQFRARCSSQ